MLVGKDRAKSLGARWKETGRKDEYDLSAGLDSVTYRTDKKDCTEATTPNIAEERKIVLEDISPWKIDEKLIIQSPSP